MYCAMPSQQATGSVDVVDNLLRILHPGISNSATLKHAAPLLPCRDGQQWGSTLTPYLRALLSSVSFREAQVNDHVSFFMDYAAPWLSPDAVSREDNATEAADSSSSSIYPSAMTNDHTPLEISCCWKSQSQNGVPIPRYVFETAASDGRTRESSLNRGISAIRELENAVASRTHNNLCYNLDVHLFPELWKQISLTMLANDRAIHSGHCPLCGPASTFIGFDISPSANKAKLYWLLPSCLPNTGLLSLLDTIFVDTFAVAITSLSSSFSSAWSTIRSYLSSASATLRPRMLSVDATKYPMPRIKLYVRCLLGNALEFSNVLPHLTLDGKLALQPDFEQTCCTLWTSLIRSIPASAPKPKYVLVLYEFSGAELSSKLYIMCQELPLSDSIIASALLESCNTMKGSLLLARLKDQEKVTAYINEIGLAPRGEQTEAAIYMNPCCFSKDSWREEGGWMEKKRVAKPES